MRRGEVIAPARHTLRDHSPLTHLPWSTWSSKDASDAREAQLRSKFTSNAKKRDNANATTSTMRDKYSRNKAV